MNPSIIFGIDDVSGPWYAFWSGFGGPLLTFLAVVAFTIRWAMCDERYCWRRGRYQLPDSLLVVCRRHRHAGMITREHGELPLSPS